MTELPEILAGEARVADSDEAISVEELQLAARNHGMPLEALHYDLTPPGLHYLLVHYDIPVLDAAAWRLEVGGHTDRTLVLDLDEIRSRPRSSLPVTMECAGNGRARLRPRPVSQPWLNEAVGTAEWTGTPLAPLLREAGVRDGAVDVAFVGADHGIERGVEQDYARGLALADALADDVLLAYEMDGRPLPAQHGAPVRLVVPGWYGMAQVKWLVRIQVLDRAFDGFQNVTAYRIKQRDEPGEPVTRMRPRALMTPPGFPDFMTRTRVVDLGEHVLEGRAWSGWAPVTRVEVSVDGGVSWAPAALDPIVGRWAWRRWTHRWLADTPGVFELQCRATDEAGNGQPTAQPWNRQGMANNLVQRIRVVVREPRMWPPSGAEPSG
jgi:DMSO/TMAO reductase YedYZ molybdopterin-dependent catalytic subunit